MKTAAMITMAAMLGTGAWANGVSEPVVTVCMDQSADSALRLAQAEASKIFSEVGVKVAWRGGRACEASDAIHIRLSDETPRELEPGALAYALPYQGNYIEVFYDRVAKTVGPATLPHLLAHVLVHEITHILQGIARHSQTGIMKARWNATDYKQMRIHHLPLTTEDVQLIQLAMKVHTEGLLALSVTPSAPQSR
jgi:hypothetical protein